MDCTLTEEQRLLQDSVARFLERQYGFAARQRILAGAGFDEAMWAQMAANGWLAALLPAALGGIGGAVETMVLMELAGRHLVLEPLVPCVLIAARILGAAPSDASRERCLRALLAGGTRISLAVMESTMRSPYELAQTQCVATVQGTGWLLSGLKTFVDGGGAANHFLVTARDSATGQLAVFSVPEGAPGLTRRSLRTLDGRTSAELQLAGVAVAAPERLLAGPEAAAALECALDHGVAAVCAEAVGLMDALLQTTIEHTRQRVQYGAPLASFQALQHRMADMYVELEAARSMALLATAAVDGGEERAARICAARIQVGRAARFIGQQAVQLHGGMGMAEEHSVAHYFKRLTLISQLCGDERLHLRRYRAVTAIRDIDAATSQRNAT